MKILKINNSRMDSLKNMTNSPHPSSTKKKDAKEFDIYLNKFLEDSSDEEIKDWYEFPILLPGHGRFWDNGYEDVDKERL